MPAYAAGESVQAIAADVGVGRVTLLKRFHEHGFLVRQPGGQRIHRDYPALYERYLAGENADDIGESVGTSGQALRRAFSRRGMPLRNRSEARTLVMGRLTVAQRRKQMAGAHAARHRDRHGQSSRRKRHGPLLSSGYSLRSSLATTAGGAFLRPATLT